MKRFPVAQLIKLAEKQFGVVTPHAKCVGQYPSRNLVLQQPTFKMNSTTSSDNTFANMVASVRNAYNSGKTRSVAFRVQQLKNMRQMIQENSDQILEALAKDLRKPKLEATLYELEIMLNELKGLINNTPKFAKPDKLPVNLLAILDSAYVRKEPYGVVLVLGAWNYPVLLTLQPAMGAICAGNCVVIKPSEIASHSAKLMAELIPKYLDKECYKVVLAEVEGTRELLQSKFDYIFCTGSPNVGKAVMAAAAPNLTPVTLELGGKSPCYVDESADFDLAAKRILWGKYANLGQTCIAPDYVLCSKEAEKSFLKVANTVLKEWYGDDLQGNSDIPRIINERHCKRLKQMLETTRGKVVFGGGSDEKDLWIEPTIVIDVPEDDPLMQDEIFGPILPIITVNSIDEAIAYINRKPRPLALYSFANNEKMNKKLIDNTTSGGVCVNDTMWHMAWHGLPFGGIGNSGMGNYHGKFSFDTFSHHRSVLSRSFGMLSEKLGEARYPPYTIGKLRFFQTILNSFEYFNFTGGVYVTHFLAALLGAAVVAIIAWAR